MTQTSPTATHIYHRDKDGCDDLLTICDAATGEEIVSIPFWDEDAAWAARAEARAELLIANPELLLSLRGASEEEIYAAIERWQQTTTLRAE